MPQIRVVWMVLSGIASNQLVTIFFQSRVHIDTYILQAKVSYDLNHFEPTLMAKNKLNWHTFVFSSPSRTDHKTKLSLKAAFNYAF